MLGNQYFMVRKFCEAKKELEEALNTDPHNQAIKKKLIICYIQLSEIKKAFDFFFEVIKENPRIIIETDIEQEDCPCPDIIYELESLINTTNENDKTLSLAMLWLYCDLHESIYYFEKYLSLKPDDEKAKALLNKLNDQLT